MKKYVVATLLGLAVLVVVLGLTTARWTRSLLLRNASASAPAAPVVAKNSPEPKEDEDVHVIRFAKNAAPAPPFLVSDLQGNVISTASFPGHVVLLSFWATWCPPCREEIPELKELQSRYKTQLQIIGVSLDDSPPQEVWEFAKHEGINYAIVMGSPEIIKEYGGVPALPTNFLIDPQGKVVQKHVGLYPLSVYDTEVRALLGMHVDAKIETFEDTGQIFLKNLKNAALETSLPGVDFKGLTEAQKKLALKRMNSEKCTCGCDMTIAQCRLLDPSCAVSKALAAKIVKEIRAGTGTGAPAGRAASEKAAGAANL
jgi:thiol-disulfide isomerase/thioredoxin